MPGVPNGRGCDECRRQKKKCNYATPSCSRCQRLGLECAGAGERRYLFIDQKCRRRRPGTHPTDTTAGSLAISRPAPSSSRFPNGAVSIAPSLPRTEVQTLAGAFVSTIAPVSVRINMAQAYGPFLEMVAARLGSHAALDNATRALVCARHNVDLSGSTAEESLARYSLAIRALRQCLDNFDPGRFTETVCAIILLVMCQVLNGAGLGDWSSHADGVVRLLHVRRGSSRPLDSLETVVRAHVRGMMVGPIQEPSYIPMNQVFFFPVQWFQGLWRRELRVDPARFGDLIAGLYDDGEEDEYTVLMRRIQVPKLLARAREARGGRISSPETSGIFAELKALYETFHGHDAQNTRTLEMARAATPQFQTASNPFSSYNFRLVVACVCSCMLRGLLGGDRKRPPPRSVYEGVLLREAEELADAAIALALEAAKCRHMGAGHLVINCLMAWVCTGDAAKRVWIQEFYEDFEHHFSGDWVGDKVFAMWEVLASDLFLVSGPGS